MDEFELTYLAKKEVVDKLKGVPFKDMLDIYLPSTSKHPNLRIRKNGNKYEMTKKSPVKEGDSSHQTENTIPLIPEEFSELSLLPGKRVEKRRYLYQEGKYKYEVDVFQGDLKGLVLVDVEFSSNEEKGVFVRPAWVLADVTQEEFVAGGMLCGKSYKDIEKKLNRFSYEKIEQPFL